MLVSEEAARSRHLTGTKRRVGHFKYLTLAGVHVLVEGGSQDQLSAGIEYFTDSKVESADIKSKTLKLAKGGDDITYDKLIIATGSTVSLLILHCAMLGRRSDLCMLQSTNAKDKSCKLYMYTSPHVREFVKHAYNGLYGQTCKGCNKLIVLRHCC